jgi:hypothetical protein
MPRIRYRLRTLLILVILVAIVLGLEAGRRRHGGALDDQDDQTEAYTRRYFQQR